MTVCVSLLCLCLLSSYLCVVCCCCLYNGLCGSIVFDVIGQG